MHTLGPRFLLTVFAILSSAITSASAQMPVRSHPAMRPLPTASTRPADAGPALYVDAVRGNDAAVGSREQPWRTIAHALRQLKPGDTLYLRAGVYHERVTMTISGTADKPITVRAHPGELAIVDGGLPDFFTSPATAWEPHPDGVAGEYRSTKAYPNLGAGVDNPNLLGFFGDSMVPLQGYRFLRDLRDPSMAWDIKNKVGDDDGGVYCGPGVFYDLATGRIHARLAPTDLKALGDANYRGETDPRKVPLVLAGWKQGPVLTLQGVCDVRVQDLVVRGSAHATVEVTDCARVTLDGLTVYSGRTAFSVRDTAGFRLLHTACRGIAAPWTFRGHLKYRSTEARLFSGGGWSPTGRDSRDFEMAYCEFTDSVDGVFIGNVHGVHFHHNLLDNVSDDGVFLTAATGYDGTTPGGDHFLYQNVFARCLTTFAFGVGHGRQKVLLGGKQTGSGVHIVRNVFDYRQPVMYHLPPDPGGTAELASRGRFASDHGSPTWEPMNIYHNTILADDATTTYFYGNAGLGDHLQTGSHRRVFNNIVVQMRGMPGTTLPATTLNLHADGNLFWSVAKGPTFEGDPFARFRQSKAFADSKAQYPPGWTTHDRFADPRFVRLPTDGKDSLDLCLTRESPAIDAGITLPEDWHDPLRRMDAGKPDLGAIPVGVEPWSVGVRGRLTMFGEAKANLPGPTFTPVKFAEGTIREYRTDVKPVAIVEGYPEFDAPMIDYALKRQDVRVERTPRNWLETAEYGRYSMVVVAGDLQRAGIEHHRYTKDDLETVDRYLRDGGTLWLLRRGKRVFDGTPEGKKWLQTVTGTLPPEKDFRFALLQPGHPWVGHLDAKAEHPWLAAPLDRDNAPLMASNGERILGSAQGSTILYRVKVGKGQILYTGWAVADSLPSGRLPVTVEQEKRFADQMQIFLNIVKDVLPRRTGF